MILKSKLSSTNKARIVFLFPVCLIIATVCIFNYFDESFKLDERRFMLIILVFMILVLTGLTVDFLNIKMIVLDDEKINIKYLMKRKSEHYLYKDIKSINSHYQKYSTKSFNLTKGYFIREYSMVDGRVLMLSPDTYENYEDLIYTINKHTAHLK